MAIIYDASKRQKIESKKDGNGKEVANKKKNASWGSKLAPIFKFAAFIHKYNIYKPYEKINIGTGWGHFLGKAFLGQSGGMQYKIKKSIQALYPNASKKRIEQLKDASIKYMGSLFLNFIFKMPLLGYLPVEKFFTYPNIDFLDKTLERNNDDNEHNGVILAVTHIGQFLNTMPAFSRHPNKYIIGSVAQLANLELYKNIIYRKDKDDFLGFNRLFVYGTTKFNNISGFLERHLWRNQILIMYHDYSTPKQLRVPFIYEKFPYLINTVQSYISLQRKTGAVIIPVIAHPDGGDAGIGKIRFELLEKESKRIMEICDKYKNAPKKEFHGRVSLEINKALYPYIRRYAHVWEEITNLGTIRLADKIKFPANITLNDFIKESFEKMKSIIDNSFEPKRDDDKLLELIKQYSGKTLDVLMNKDEMLRSHKTKIDLSWMNSISELEKLSLILIKELKHKKEVKCVEILYEFRKKINI